MGTCFMIGGAASGVPKRRHFSSVDVALRKRLCTFFFTGFIPKKTLSIPASCRFSIGKTDEISRTLHCMHNSKIFMKPYQELTENNLIRAQRSQRHVAV
jgi:hypothetical protein